MFQVCPLTPQVDNIQSDALFILLVEKDAAFMRLAEDRFYNTYPCIILTAKGQVGARLHDHDHDHACSEWVRLPASSSSPPRGR